MKVLLTSVFGPYGVDDEYSCKETPMELFHNQVTGEQDLFSLRFNHHSFGLYLIAENIGAPTTVLDFPTQQQFIEEIKKGYDYVGISFVMPNFLKAKRMAQLVREHAPASKIVLGGHGAQIPEVETEVEHDHLCRGEGVRWFRELLGEDPDAKLVHPVLPSAFSGRVLGIPSKTEAALLIPGVGCPNACRFCATSSFFGRRYTPFFETGKELFDACVKIEEQLGMTEFFVMDENFLKRPQRARELMELMEQHNKLYRFAIFSSAEAIAAAGIDLVTRLGTYFIWLGVESQQEVFEKNKGIDLKAMVRELRSHGISVLTSLILFLEHHDKQSVWDEINFVVGLEPDLTQFMQLTPFPTTSLYQEYEQQGVLLKDVPFPQRHGPHRIWFRHPSFTPEESEDLVRQAFRHEYDTLGSGVLRMLDTTIRGYRTLARYSDPVMVERRRQLREIAERNRAILPVLRRHAHNDRVRALTDQVIERYEQELGPAALKQRLLTGVAHLLAAREKARVRSGRALVQPKMVRTDYRMPLLDLASGKVVGRSLAQQLTVSVSMGTARVRVELAGVMDRVNARSLAHKLIAYLRRDKGKLEVVLNPKAVIEDNALFDFIDKIKRFRDRISVRIEQESQQPAPQASS